MPRRLSLLVLLGALAAPAIAGAQEHEAGHAAEAAEHAPSVPDAVFAHVADAREVELENPFTGSHVAWHLPTWILSVGGTQLDLSPTRHTVFMWLAALILVVGLTLISRARMLVPRGIYSVAEVFVTFVRDEIAVPNIGREHAHHYTGYLVTVFFFVVTMNLLGLFPYSATATGNISVTAGLALCTFAMTLLAGMREQGVVGFWLHIVPSGVPWWLYPIMIPVELLSLLTKPFALAIRLFANMVAGHVVIFFLIGLIFLLSAAGPFIAPVSVAFATFIYLLEIFVALLQAYIFTMLSALFIGLASHPH